MVTIETGQPKVLNLSKNKNIVTYKRFERFGCNLHMNETMHFAPIARKLQPGPLTIRYRNRKKVTKRESWSL